MDKKISIIIPVYNTEKLLKRCLDSLIHQTYNNLEIICVNDCSVDDSPIIIKEYMEKDKRICLVNNKTNLGLFHARIEGIKVSKGDYIAFLDSDDYVSLDYYRCLIEKAEEENADIVFSKIIHENAQGRRYIHNSYSFLDIENDGREPFERYFEQEGRCFIWHTVWNKIYSKSIWERALPYLTRQEDHMIMTEDFVFSTVLFYFAKKISSVEYSFHFYYQHAAASTSLAGGYKKYKKNITDLVNAFNFVKDFLNEVNANSVICLHFDKWKELYARFWHDNVMNSNLSGEQKRYLITFLKKGLGCPIVATKSEDHYFYKVITDWDDRYYKLQNYLINGKIKVYSFDIYDTLLFRPFAEPSDLFLLLDNTYHKLFNTSNSFAEIRKVAERRLRELKRPSEATIDEIYDFIAKQYLLDVSRLEKLKEEELDFEFKKTYVRKSIFNIYKMLVSLSKRIIIISDIYLDEAFIKRVLERNGITQYEKLFLSSKYRKTKASGELYKSVINDLRINPNDIFHIGDNWTADFLMAKEKGLQTHFYAKAIDVFKNSISDIPNTEVYNAYFKPSNSWLNVEKSYQFVGVRTAIAVCANHLCDNPYSSFNRESNFNFSGYYMGYFPVGMFLLGVSKWIKQNKGDNAGLHFIGRDGYLFQRAYKALFKEETSYVELSRKALLPLSVISKADIMSISKYINFKNTNRKKLFDMLEPILEKEKTNGIDFELPFEDENDFYKFLSYIAENLYSEEKNKNYRKVMKSYFSTIFKEGDILFDVGYSGRSQIILSQLLGYPINGLFIHINGDENLCLQQLLGIDIKTFYNFTPSVTGSQREYLFSKQVGSLKKFTFIDGKVEKENEDNRFSYVDKFCIGEIQDNAVKFVEHYEKYFSDCLNLMYSRNIDLAIPFEKLVHNSYNDLTIFDACRFEDALWDGRESIVLSDIWRRDIRYHYSQRVEKIYVEQTKALGENDIIIKDFKKKSKFKKAICYFFLDRAKFKHRLKKWLAKK